MSTILDALKKLEIEHGLPSAPGDLPSSHLNPNNPEGHVHKRNPKRRSNQKLAAMALVALVCCVFVLVYHYQQSAFLELNPSTIQEKTLVDTALTSAAQPQRLKRPSSGQPVAKVSIKGSASPPPPPQITPKPIDNPIQRLPAGRIQLQAIVWAPAAVERMAVINNRVLAEKESLDGFSIVSINMDDVVLDENGKLWKVLLGR